MQSNLETINCDDRENVTINIHTDSNIGHTYSIYIHIFSCMYTHMPHVNLYSVRNRYTHRIENIINNHNNNNNNNKELFKSSSMSYILQLSMLWHFIWIIKNNNNKKKSSSSSSLYIYFGQHEHG